MPCFITPPVCGYSNFILTTSSQRVLLSTLPCHVAMETPSFELKKGDVIEDVDVVRVTKRGVYISLENGQYQCLSVVGMCVSYQFILARY